VILAVFLLVVLTATLVTFILPEKYTSSTRIRVEQDGTDITSVSGNQAFARGYDPYFIQTEFEIIQSEAVLGKVAANQNLTQKWMKRLGVVEPLKPEEAVMVLKRMVDLRPVRNTSLLEIRVESEDAKEACDLANDVAQEYRRFRMEQKKSFARSGIDVLAEEYAKLVVGISNKQEIVVGLRTNLGISDLDAWSAGPSQTIETETLRRMESLRIEGQAKYIGKKQLLESLLPLTNSEPKVLRNVLPTAVPDSLLNSYLEQIALAEQRQVQLSKTFGSEHAELKAVNAQIEDLDQKIKDRVDGILVGLRSQVDAAKAELDSLKDEVETARKADQEKAAKSRPYFDAKRELDDQIRFRNILQVKMTSEKIDNALPSEKAVIIVDKATVSDRPSKPNKPLNIALGVMLGLIVGVGLAFFIEYLDTSVKTIDDVEKALGSPVLGVIPQNVGYLLFEGAESPHAEAYRVLRTNILFTRKDERLNSICVVSAGAGEGKTTTAFNLATVFAQSGQRTIIVDSDLRRPTLHKLMRVSNSLGLTSYLLKQNTLEEVAQTTNLPTLDFISSGKLPSSSLGILSSPRMKEMIHELKQRYDIVVFDSPPIMGVSDASVLASEVDLTLQVIQYRRYPQPMNIRAKHSIEKVGGTLIGIVLNNINMSQDESYYYYSGYYHDYYYSKKEDEGGEKKTDGKSADKKDKVEVKQKY
jgi:capsular exopolysaccharide synthesis family protein